ncbi:MAG: biotin/lipoyl-containing protein, partial [Pseudolysinimonas sp.]
MAREFLLPDLGEGLTEAAIVTWLVQPGDIIAIDQPVVEVESAKSTVELPSPYGGRVEKLHAAAGETVHKGGVLITVVEASVDEPTDAPADIVPGTALRSEGMDAGSGAVLVGYGTKESTLRLARPAGGRFGSRQQATPDRRSPVVSPLVRRRALDHGIDATQLTGSGPGSLVVRRDVDAAIAAQDASASPAVSPASAPAPAAPAPGDQRIPITGMRKIIGTRL